MNAFHLLAPLAAVFVAVTATALFFLPEMSRPDMFFAVRVAGDFRRSETAKRILRGYRLSIAAAAVVAAGIALVGAAVAPVGVPFVVAWLFGASIFAIIRARRAALPHAVSIPPIREASLAVHRPPPESRLWIQAIPLLPFIAAGWVLSANWDRLPARYSVHRDLSGHPSGRAATSPLRVAGLLFAGVALCAIIAWIWNLGVRFTRRAHPSGAAGEAETRFRTGFARLGLVLEGFIALNFSAMAVLPLWSPNGARRLLPWFPFAMLTVVGCMIAWCVRLSRSRGKFPRAVSGDLAPDDCWKAGVFYLNANDQALVVEKRFGMGYTLNLAHPAAWVLLAALFLIAVTIVLLKRL